jgi:hypothetical protein
MYYGLDSVLSPEVTTINRTNSLLSWTYSLVGEMDIKNVITIKHIVNSFLAKNKYSIATAYILGLNTTVLSLSSTTSLLSPLY